MPTPSIQQLASRVFDLVRGGCVRGEIVTSREVYGAAAADLIVVPGYDPELDVRVRFLRDVLRAIRMNEPFTSLDAELVFCAGFALGKVKASKHWQEVGA
jgi:hypothetical protein